MIVLGIDTSCAVSAVALTDDSTLISSYSLCSTLEHSTVLLPMIERVLSDASLSMKDVDLVSVTNGPGSFTGIRIGISTVKGLAFPFDTPCIGVSTLESLAWQLAGLDGIICPVIDAKNMNVYTALFESDVTGDVKRITDDDVLPISDLGDVLKDKKVFLVGDAADKTADSLSGITFCETPEMLKVNSGYGTAVCGRAAFSKLQGKSGKAVTHYSLKPVYLRKTMAERNREKQLNLRKAD